MYYWKLEKDPSNGSIAVVVGIAYNYNYNYYPQVAFFYLMHGIEV
jgi:hypothetical protein